MTEARANIIADAPSARSRTRNATIATLGNLVEWFDFTIYGFLALTISQVFFSITEPTLALLASFVTFGIGSGARPVGAFIFGRLGDRRGRRFVLIASISMMAAGSCLIGIAPGYATAGIGGAIILVFGRLLQGLSAGAEFGSAIAYLIEWAPPGRRGLYGSFHQVGAGVGLLMGALISALINSVLGPDAVLAWGWRIPFLLGSVLAIGALLLRLTLDETPEFERIVRRAPSSAVSRSSFVRPVLQNIGIMALWSVSVFASVIYMPTFMVQSGQLEAGRALWATTIALVAMLITIPLAGAATDRFGTRTIVLTASIGYMLCAVPGFAFVASGATYGATIAVVGLFGVLCGIISGVGPVAIGELYRANVRSTGTSIASAVATTVFGGFAPAICTLLIAETGINAAPGFYVMFAAILTAATALTLRPQERGQGG